MYPTYTHSRVSTPAIPLIHTFHSPPTHVHPPRSQPCIPAHLDHLSELGLLQPNARLVLTTFCRPPCCYHILGTTPASRLLGCQIVILPNCHVDKNHARLLDCHITFDYTHIPYIPYESDGEGDSACGVGYRSRPYHMDIGEHNPPLRTARGFHCLYDDNTGVGPPPLYVHGTGSRKSRNTNDNQPW